MKTLRKFLSVTGLHCEYTQNGCAIVAFDSGAIARELWHLADYRVSSANGNTVFLRPIN